MSKRFVPGILLINSHYFSWNESSCKNFVWIRFTRKRFSLKKNRKRNFYQNICKIKQHQGCWRGGGSYKIKVLNSTWCIFKRLMNDSRTYKVWGQNSYLKCITVYKYVVWSEVSYCNTIDIDGPVQFIWPSFIISHKIICLVHNNSIIRLRLRSTGLPTNPTAPQV